MATVNETAVHEGGVVHIFTWTPLTNVNVDGRWRYIASYTDASVEMFGTFGGATVGFQGSNAPRGTTPTVGITIRDTGKVILEFTVNDLRQILEGVSQIRPLLTGGDGTTSVTVRVRTNGPEKMWQAQE